jgi:hypothetical protein
MWQTPEERRNDFACVDIDSVQSSHRKFTSPHSGLLIFHLLSDLWFAPQATNRRCSAANRSNESAAGSSICDWLWKQPRDDLRLAAEQPWSVASGANPRNVSQSDVSSSEGATY